MNRRAFLKAASVSGLVGPATAAFGRSPLDASQQKASVNNSVQKHQPVEKSPEQILLKDYRPKSIYKIPVTEVEKAKYPIIDMHSHPYAKTPEQIAEWVATMDEVGVEKTIILTAAVGGEFDAIHRQYAKYPERFEMWCGFDLRVMTGQDFASPLSEKLKDAIRWGSRSR